MIQDLVRTNRSYRRFAQNQLVSIETLTELVDLGRLSASGRNLQPLRYMLSCDPQKNAQIFQSLGWAGYLKDGRPVEGEQPSAYIIMLGDTELAGSFGVDSGIAAQSMMLGAVEKGLGGCIMSSIKRSDLAAAMHIPARYEIVLILALGKPIEHVVIEPVGPDGDIKYWRDSDGIHHVPKRSLQDIIIG